MTDPKNQTNQASTTEAALPPLPTVEAPAREIKR